MPRARWAGCAGVEGGIDGGVGHREFDDGLPHKLTAPQIQDTGINVHHATLAASAAGQAG